MRNRDSHLPKMPASPEALVWLVFVCVCSFCAPIVGPTLAGFRVCGWMWLLPLLLGILLSAVVHRRMTFPLGNWVPWILVVVLTADVLTMHGLQRSLMILAPLIVACCASALIRSKKEVELFLQFACSMIVPFWILLVLLGTSGEDSSIFIGSRSSAMTVCLIGCMFLARMRHQGWKGAIAVLSVFAWLVVAGARGAILGLSLCIPILAHRRRMLSRLAITTAIIGTALLAFKLPQVQERFFWGGSGSVNDIFEGRFDSAGRLHTWPIYWDEIKESIWLGHGARESEQFGLVQFGEKWGHPHNEYIKILFDYGLVGLGAWLLGITSLFVSMLRLRRDMDSCVTEAATIAVAGIVVMFVLAFTDNALVYAAFFGNMLFALIGSIYGAISGEASFAGSSFSESNWSPV